MTRMAKAREIRTVEHPDQHPLRILYRLDGNDMMNLRRLGQHTLLRAILAEGLPSQLGGACGSPPCGVQKLPVFVIIVPHGLPSPLSKP